MQRKLKRNTDLHTGVFDALMPQQKLVVICVIMTHITCKLGITVAHFMSSQMP